VRWLGSFVLGGGSAALVQGATAALRLGSTGTTGGAANFLLASGENLAAIATPIFTIILPVTMAIIILLTFWLAYRLITRRRRKSA